MILGINTASSVTTLILIKDGEMVESVFWESRNDEAERIMPEIDRMLEGDYSGLREVFVVKGPGSFTGLRVGVTVANTLAYLTGAKLYSFSTFDYWHQLSGGRDVVVFAGKGAVYLSKNGEYQIVNLDELEIQGEVFGDISEIQKEVIGSHYVPHDGQWDQQLFKVYNRLRDNLTEEKLVKPLYVKRPGITQSKKCFT